MISGARTGAIGVLCAAGWCCGVRSAESAERLDDSPADATPIPPVPPGFEDTTDIPGRETGARRRPEPAVSGEPELPEWFGGKPWMEWSHGLGTLGGVRTDLESIGLTFNGSITYDWSTVLKGGLRRRASTRSLLDANLSYDLEKAIDLKGGKIFGDFMATDMRGGSRDVGDVQGFDDIESGTGVHQLSELWYEQSLFDGAVRVKVGKVDANLEFAFIRAGDSFAQSGDVLDPVNTLMPTYPDPALGLNIFVYPTESLYAGVGIYDGSLADGVRTGRVSNFKWLGKGQPLYTIAEVGVTWERLGAFGAGRVALGAFHNSGDLQKFGGGTADGVTGGYAVAEQRLDAPLIKNEAGEFVPAGVTFDGRGVFSFLRGGVTDDRVSLIHYSLGAGILTRGTIEGRSGDSAGVLCSLTVLSHVRGSPADGNEVVFEAFYEYAFTKWLTVKQDIQYIINPGGNPRARDAIVGMLRFKIAF